MSLPSTNTSIHDYTLDFSVSKIQTKIIMQVPPQFLTTDYIPCVFDLLSKRLPSIFFSKCYNTQNLPFSDEMRKTELAHLYEHMLLENLAFFNAKRVNKKKYYTGLTTWNWKKDPRGLFRIYINVGENDFLLLSHALEETNKLLDYILAVHKKSLN